MLKRKKLETENEKLLARCSSRQVLCWVVVGRCGLAAA